MIRSFRDRETERIWNGRGSRRLPPEVQETAARKLRAIDAAEELGDLRIPPGNCLEALSGDRAGQHTVRINQQWRICFRWCDGDCEDVEICDYHR